MGADTIDVSFVPAKTSTDVNQTNVLHPVYNILATATLRLASTTEANLAVHYERSHVLVYSFISVGTVATIVLVAFVVRKQLVCALVAVGCIDVYIRLWVYSVKRKT